MPRNRRDRDKQSVSQWNSDADWTTWEDSVGLAALGGPFAWEQFPGWCSIAATCIS